MVNWMELELWARTRYEASLTEAQRWRMAYDEDLAVLRRPLKARIGSALVRIGARLDPAAVVVQDPERVFAETQAKAYLRSL